MTETTITEEVLVDCKDVWKIFGNGVNGVNNAIAAINEKGLSKAEILKDYNCVIGVSEANLQVRRGEIFCIMGLSGSGKSTLVRLLNRLIEPSMGKVFIKGKDISTLNPAELREMRSKNIGMVFQSVALLPNRNVLENTAFGLEVRGVGKEERNKIALESLTKVGLSEWVNRYPSELSGGMQQRVGLARALTSDPEIILMDEPFSALDPLIRRQLQDEFRQLTKELGKSAVFITHDLDEAIRIGDRIAIMKDGVIIQTGTAEEIVLKPADPYVADFVAGISRMHLIKAHSLMISVEEYYKWYPDMDVAELAKATVDMDVDQLIRVMLESNFNALSIVEKDTIIGVVTIRNLLSGLKDMPSNEQGRME